MRGVSLHYQKCVLFARVSLSLAEIEMVASKAKAYGLGNVTNGSFDVARDRLVLIGTKLGSRAKNSVLRMHL